MKPILLTVNRRLARAFKTTFHGRVLSWEDFLLELFELNRAETQSSQWRLSILQEKMLWARSMEDFPTFGFAREQTIDCARDAYTLVKAYRLNSEGLKGYKEDSDLFATAMERFETECASLNAFSPASLIEKLMQNPIQNMPIDHVYCYGFDEWTPAQEALIAQWESAGVKVERMPQVTRQSQVKKVIATDARDEFKQAATYAKAAFERGETVAIVVPQLQAQWSTVLHQLAEVFNPDFYFPGSAEKPVPYNISSGASLDKQPIIYCLLETFKTLDKETTIQTWGNILHTPFLKGGCTEASARAAYDMRLRDKESLTLSLNIVRSSTSIPAIFKLQLDHVATVKDALNARTMRDWILWLREWIEMWGFAQERTLSSAEYQCIDTFHDALRQLYALDVLKSCYLFHEFVDALCGLLKNTLFQTETQDKPIQVLGLLEAAGLSFDNVWVIGLTADNNPAKAMPHPFIPTQVQISYDMPHSSPERELRVAKRLLDRLIRGADNVIVSYAAHDEKGEPQLESPLISSISTHELSQNTPARMSARIAQTREFQSYEDHTGLPLVEKHLKGGSSVLRDQAACPHRAYLKHRLAASSPRSPVLGLSSREQGTIVHRVLENFWNELKSRTALMSLDDDALFRRVEKHIAEVINAWEPVISLSNKIIESKRIQDILIAWLTYEKSRPDFSIVSLEKKMEVTLNELTLTLKMDRLDSVGDNQFLLMDYKTGEAHVSGWNVPRMEEPQLPLYAAFMTPTPIGMAYARLKKNSMKLDGIIDDEQWEVLLDAFRRDLQLLAEEVKEGVADLSPKNAKQTCSACELEPGCRMHTGGVYER